MKFLIHFAGFIFIAKEVLKTSVLAFRILTIELWEDGKKSVKCIKVLQALS